jgi:hypothetical protein
VAVVQTGPNTTNLWPRAIWASLRTQLPLTPATMVFNPPWIERKSVFSRKKIYNYRQLLEKEKAIIMRMCSPQIKSSLIRATYKRGLMRRILTTKCQRLEELTATSQFSPTDRVLCQYKELHKERTLIRELCKETWIRNFRTFNRFKWRTKDSKISSLKTSDP